MITRIQHLHLAVGGIAVIALPVHTGVHNSCHILVAVVQIVEHPIATVPCEGTRCDRLRGIPYCLPRGAVHKRVGQYLGIVIVGERSLIVNDTIDGISEKYTFGTMPKGEVIYSEKSLEGNLCVAYRTESEEETPVSLELLFEAVNENPSAFKK